MNQKLLEAIEVSLRREYRAMAPSTERKLAEVCFRRAIEVVRLEFERSAREEEQKGDE